MWSLNLCCTENEHELVSKHYFPISQADSQSVVFIAPETCTTLHKSINFKCPNHVCFTSIVFAWLCSLSRAISRDTMLHCRRIPDLHIDRIPHPFLSLCFLHDLVIRTGTGKETSYSIPFCVPWHPPGEYRARVWTSFVMGNSTVVPGIVAR